MLRVRASLIALLGLLELQVLAQSPAWGQCGGVNWTGPTTCVSGYACQVYNTYYYQCIPSSQVTTTTSTIPTSTSKSSTVVSSTASSTTVSSTASSTVISSSALPTATSTIGLNTAAKAAGKLYLGSATDNGELSDAPYLALLSDTTQFGSITPGNSMKWDATEKSRGVFTFSGGDVIADLAKKNGQLLRGHTCVWHSQLPSWVSSGGFNASELTSIINTHCTTLVSHYKGQVYAWDVVNEPFNEDGTYRDSVFYTTLNTTFVGIALRAARAADPAAKLYINDYNLEYGGAKTNAMVTLAKQLLAEGAPLDGIGFQGHLIVGSTPSATNLATQLKLFADLGLDVAITELDIRMTVPATDALLAQQKKDYQSVVSACQQVARCVGVTIWDYTDKYSWIPSVFSGQGAALPWTENLVKKPAYDGIVAGFLPNGVPASSSVPASTTATASSTSAYSSAAALPTATSKTALNVAAKAVGKYLGSATDNGELSDTTYAKLLNDTTQFGSITPGNSMKWDATEKSRGVFTFSGGDTIANLAKANGQLLRGHTCVWHSQLPSWVSSGGFNASELTSIINTHCTTLISHYKGQVYAWDVVNEPFNEDGTYRDSVFYTTLNTSFVATALRAARAADPAAKLYINDYNLEYGGAKTNAMVTLAKQLLAEGAPLDGIGFQGHLIVGSTPSASNLATQIKLFADLGLDVAITELDIRMTLPATAALYAQQQKDYQSVVAACKAVTKCVGVTIWDYTDKYSWIPSVFSGQGAALPWDENYVKKPAYDGIIAGFAA